MLRRFQVECFGAQRRGLNLQTRNWANLIEQFSQGSKLIT